MVINVQKRSLESEAAMGDEKNQLQVARQLRVFDDVPPDDEEFDDIFLNARRKQETNIVPVMPCIAISFTPVLT